MASTPASHHFHCGRHYMLVRHLSTPPRQNRKNTKHKRTNNLQCLLTDPNDTSPREVFLKKHGTALNRAWLSLSHWGKSSSSRQQDLFFKGESFSTPSQRQACNSPFSQAHAFFHSLVQRKLPCTIASCLRTSLLADVEEICRTELEILCLNLAAERD